MKKVRKGKHKPTKKRQQKKEGKVDRFFKWFGVFWFGILLGSSIIYLIFSSYYNGANLGDLARIGIHMFEIEHYENAVGALHDTEYVNISKSAIWLINQKCDFDMLHYSREDVFCVANETFYLFNNQYYVYDYDNDGIKNCRDKSISYTYILREFGIDTHFVLTNEHVLVVVEMGSDLYLFSDPSYGGLNMVNLGDYFYGRLVNDKLI